MSLKHTLLKVGLPLLILVAGGATMALLIHNRSLPKKEVREFPGALVEVLPVTRGPRQVEVAATGTVQPRREISLVPEVSGRVTEVAADFIAGGFFRQGEVLFRLEDADYRLAVDQARAALAKAEYELATMASQARIARREWELLQPRQEEPNPLVLYEPQLKNAEAALLSAKAALAQAELNLGRTVVRAPFNALVRSESLDLGQYLRAGTGVAVLAGSDRAEIVVPLPLAELGWLQIPPRDGGGRGSAATIRLATGDWQWQGEVVRTLGDVDPQGRMFRVVVAVDDPYGLNAGAPDRPELALGSFVEVTLHGARLEDVAVLPAAALREGERVWLMNDAHLRFRTVEVLRRTRDEVVVAGGLEEGDRVVLTPLAGAAEGMKLRAAEARP